MPYSLNERALYALLTQSDEKLRMLVALMERITEDPDAATTGFRFSRGRRMNVSTSSSYQILFTVGSRGHVSFQEIIPK